jgi:class 3 adenylate cyclase/tetratricopeptide (TPR) repeat protein/ABC-type cobalamin transport system ATPase subunit
MIGLGRTVPGRTVLGLVIGTGIGKHPHAGLSFANLVVIHCAMKCSACGLENPDEFAFCGRCGHKLTLVCPNCGTESPPGFAFCGHCGTRLSSAGIPGALVTKADLGRLRRYLPPSQLDDLPPVSLWQKQDLIRVQGHLSQVLDVIITYLPRHLVQTELAPGDVPAVGGTFLDGALLFADISGFTAMAERLSSLGKDGAEQIINLVNRYFGAMLEVLFAYGGDLFKFGGDALLAFFPAEVGGSSSALQAAWAMQETMTTFHQIETSLGTFPLQMKIGLHTGAVFAARVGTIVEREFIVTGPTVNATAKAETLANAGQILISPAVYEQVRDSGVLTAVEGPSNHYLVERIHSRAPTSSPSYPLALPTAANLHDDGRADTLRWTLDALECLTPYLPPGLLPRLVPAPSQHEISGEHRLVAILFANFRGASELVTRLGRDRADDIAQALNQYFVAMHQAISRYGGVVNKIDIYDRGDNLMAIFGAPVAHEDDAERAVRAALEMQAAMPSLASPSQAAKAEGKKTWLLGQRIGISTGMVVAGHVGAASRREYTVMGDEVNLAARLMSAAAEGEILLASFVQRKVVALFELADRGKVFLKGKSKPVPTHTIVGRRAQPEPVRGIRGLHSPLVGRADPIMVIQWLIEELRTGRGSIVSLIGEAGVGKSRLVAELRNQVIADGDITWLDGRCLSYTQQVSYSALIDVIHTALGIVETDNQFDIRVKLRRRVDELLPDEASQDILPYLARFLDLPLSDPEAERVTYLEGEALQRQILRAVAMFLAQMAQERPLILAFDDLHWADSASLALLERCLTLTYHAPVLILLVYRPERTHGCWALGQAASRDYPHRYSEIHLNPLNVDADQDKQLVCNLLSLEELPPALIQLIDRAEGNPFYIEEIIRTLIDRGTIVRENGHWQLVQEIDLQAIPDTLQRIIMARLDRLPEEARRTLQLAAVVGRIFPYQVLSYLASAAALAAQLDAGLVFLQRAELVRERSRVPELEYIFKHRMIHDVAYESLLMRDRRLYHRLVAQHLESLYTGQKLREAYELLAHHCSRSDDQEKGLHYLIKSGDKARAAYANPEAIAFYRQAESLAEELGRPQEQAAIAEGLGDVLFHIGEYDEALICYESALRHNPEVRQQADLHRRVAMVHEKQGEYEAALAACYRGIELLSPDGERTVEMAQLLTQCSRVYRRQGKNDAALMNGKASLVILKGTTHYREIARAHNVFGLAFRDTQPSKAVEHLEQALAILERIGDEYEAARIYNNLAIIYYQTDLARSTDYFGRALETMQRLGDVWGEASALQNLGIIHYGRGQYAQAVDYYQRSLEMKERLGDNLGIAQCHINLGEAYRAQGDPPQAIVHLEKALSIARKIGASDPETECYRQLAECYLEANDPERALAACQQALSHVKKIGNRKEEGNIYRVLGSAYLQSGDPASAQTYLEQSVMILRNLSQEFDLATALYDYAQALTQLKQTALAKEQLSAALGLFEGLGLPREQERVQVALDQLT